jgi:hypothetical protein
MRLAWQVVAVILVPLASCNRETGRQPAAHTSRQAEVRTASVPDSGVDPSLSPVEAAPIPAVVRAACDTAAMLVRATFGLEPGYREGNFTDSFQGAARTGCRITAHVSFTPARDSVGGIDQLQLAFTRRHWGQDLRYSADGPDGSDIGVRLREVICILMERGNGDDDEDSAAVARAASADENGSDVIVECARDVASNVDAGVPDSIWKVAAAGGLDSLYAIAVRLQYPPYLRGDFDGDGVTDAAVLIEQRSTGKLGVALVHMGMRRVFIVGAGTPVTGGPDDLSWIDQWEVFPKDATFDLIIKDRPSSHLLGDALWIARRDSASAFLVWTGSGYAWEKHNR